MTARPYSVEFPGSDADKRDPYCRSHNAVSLERALGDARQVLWFRWKENHGLVYPQADVAVITNRNTGDRWILRRDSNAVGFQTPGMLAGQVASDQLNLFLSVEEAEALAGAAESAEVTDKRMAALARQLRLLASQVREARRQAETHVDWHAELKRDLRRVERDRAEGDLAKAETAVARLRGLLARQPEPPDDPRAALVVSARTPRCIVFLGAAPSAKAAPATRSTCRLADEGWAPGSRQEDWGHLTRSSPTDRRSRQNDSRACKRGRPGWGTWASIRTS